MWGKAAVGRVTRRRVQVRCGAVKRQRGDVGTARTVKGQRSRKRQWKVGRRQQRDFAKEQAFQHLPKVIM